MRRTPFILALCAFLAGCGPFSPETQAANRYVKQLQPLLVENGHLSERVLGLAASVYNKEGESDQLARKWTEEVVPLAEHLHHQSQFVEATDSWATRHGELVEIWGDRALAYRSLSEALVLADVEEWEKGRAQATEVKLREEEWFKESNQILANSGQLIDPTP